MHALMQTRSEYTDNAKEPRAGGQGVGAGLGTESPFLELHVPSILGAPVLTNAGRPGVRAASPPAQGPHWL